MTPEEKKESRLKTIKLYSLTDRGKAAQKRSQESWYNRTIGAIYGVLGSKCIKCGFVDIRALQIDHINGDGAEHRKKNGNSNSYYSSILKSVIAGENKYQILCANCNFIKARENNEKRDIKWNKII